MPSVPAGWEGPVALVDAPDGNGDPDCRGAFGQLATTAFAEVRPSSPTCDCECAAPADAACSTLELYADDDAACDAAPLDSWTLGSACSNAVNHGVGNRFWRATSEVDEGSCAPMATEEIPSPDVIGRVGVCALDAAVDEQGCSAGELCVPIAAPPLDGRLCVWTVGESDCPGPDWADAEVLFQEFTDTRDCSECTCGSPTGACTGVVTVFSADCGQGGLVTTQVTIGAACDQANGGFLASSAAVDALVPDQPACEPSASRPIGDLTATSPITLCCR